MRKMERGRGRWNGSMTMKGNKNRKSERKGKQTKGKRGKLNAEGKYGDKL